MILKPLYSNLSIYPNSFSKNVTFNLELKTPETISLMIYNIRGQFIIEIANFRLGKGKHQFQWNSKDKNSFESPSGIYFCHFKSSKGNYFKNDSY